MSNEKSEDQRELDYIEDHRRAWLTILQYALRELGTEDVEAEKAAWVSERQETIGILRQVCRDHGDNDWPDNLHLADVVEKHLYRCLQDEVIKREG